ncbi:MAG: DUF4177 domain-containing protein [Nanoarchaeota archaeon]
MVKEYLVKGIIHAGILNPWKVNKEGIFEKATDELNEMAKKGWELVTVMQAGNNDRGIYIFKK